MMDHRMIQEHLGLAEEHVAESEEVVAKQLDAEFAASRTLRHLLIVVEPLYLVALQRLFDHLDRLSEVLVIPDPWAWQNGLAKLRCWGWA